MAGGSSSKSKIQSAERRNTALSYRKAGASYRAIAAKVATELGIATYSEAQAHRDVAAALKDLNEKTALNAAAYRELELERLDTALLAIAQLVKSGDLGAIDRWIRLSESRRKLLGLDAPVQVQVEEKIEAELDHFLGQLETLLPAQVYRQVLEAAAHATARSGAAERN